MVHRGQGREVRVRWRRQRRSEAARTPLPAYQFEILTTQDEDAYLAFVYLGVELVFEVAQPVAEFPAGIEDFSNWSIRMLARRLRTVLQPDPDDPGMSGEVAAGLR